MAKLQDKFFNRVIEGELEAKEEIQASVVQAPNGAVDKVLGINPLGKLVKGTISGGTKLYKHYLTIYQQDLDEEEVSISLYVISTSSVSINQGGCEELYDLLVSSVSINNLYNDLEGERGFVNYFSNPTQGVCEIQLVTFSVSGDNPRFYIYDYRLEDTYQPLITDQVTSL